MVRQDIEEVINNVPIVPSLRHKNDTLETQLRVIIALHTYVTHWCMQVMSHTSERPFQKYINTVGALNICLHKMLMLTFLSPL